MNLNNLVSGVSLTLPGWALAAGALCVVLMLILILRPRNDANGLATLAQLALVAVVAGAAYFGLKQQEDGTRLAERRAIEDRVALLSQANQPESVLGCLHVSVAPALNEACERTIFAEPQRITSAIAVTADRLALLHDGVTYADRDPGFADRLEPLRRSLELDPYGIVAHVLETDFKCIAESCPRLRMFKDSEKIKANLAKATFNGLLAKHKESWAKNSSEDQDGEVSNILTLGVRPENNEALNWGPQEDSQTPAEPFVPQATIAPPTSTPVATRPSETATPPANTKQKAAPARQKQQPVATEQPKRQPVATEQRRQPSSPTQARKRSGPPEPVGGLPRVTARGTDPIGAEDEDDTPPAPPPPPQNRSPFNIFGR